MFKIASKSCDMELYDKYAQILFEYFTLEIKFFFSKNPTKTVLIYDYLR
jgi:hypothetical protein